MASKVDVSKPCPYQFEPRKLTVTQDDDDDDDDDKEHKETEDTNIKELDWCTCNNCINMKTSDENVCCQDYTAIQEKIQEFTETRGLLEDIACITEHEGFLHNCLSIYVLERDLARMRLDKSEEEEELIHETYRHIAYRNFVLWIWHVLGKKKRVILPACVVGKIRQTFPSETDLYCGFKYPQPLYYQALNFGMIVSSALMIWKGLMVVTGSESPIVVMLSGGIEPAFHRGDMLLLINYREEPIRVGEIVVFKIEGRDFPIVHRVLKVHEKEDGTVRFLTKGDNNSVDDRGLYAKGQLWLEKKDVVGRAKAYLPYAGIVTILMNHYPKFKERFWFWGNSIMQSNITSPSS